jgi:hypothetical protein
MGGEPNVGGRVDLFTGHLLTIHLDGQVGPGRGYAAIGGSRILVDIDTDQMFSRCIWTWCRHPLGLTFGRLGLQLIDSAQVSIDQFRGKRGGQVVLVWLG